MHGVTINRFVPFHLYNADSVDNTVKWNAIHKSCFISFVNCSSGYESIVQDLDGPKSRMKASEAITQSFTDSYDLRAPMLHTTYQMYYGELYQMARKAPEIKKCII